MEDVIQMRLFRQDPYITEFRSRISEIVGNKIVLNETAFYPESGGQIGDTGFINEISVLDTQYSKSGKTIYHLLEDVRGLKKGETISGRIDWLRRHRIMRHHSGLHLVFVLFQELYGEHKIIGSQVREDKARVDFEYFGAVDIEILQENLNAIIKGDSRIAVYADVKDQDYRYWKVEGYLPVPCGGTHVRSTSEIGCLQLKLKSLGTQGIRIYCSTFATSNS